MEVLSITNKAGGAREIRRSRVEAGGWRSPDQPEVGHPSKQQHGGGRHHLNLPHHQVGHPPVLDGTTEKWAFLRLAKKWFLA